jgi:hypothetical protein
MINEERKKEGRMMKERKWRKGWSEYLPSSEGMGISLC